MPVFFLNKIKRVIMLQIKLLTSVAGYNEKGASITLPIGAIIEVTGENDSWASRMEESGQAVYLDPPAKKTKKKVDKKDS